MSKLNRRGLMQAGIGGAVLSGLGLPAMAQQVRGVSARSIKLGQMVPLTGPVASYGVAFRDGTAAYVSLVNERGGVNGRKLEIQLEDNAFSAAQSLTIAKKMVANDGIFALINSQGTAQINAVIPYMVEQEKTPIFGTYGGAIEWFTPPKPGLFGLQVLHEESAGALGRWTAKDGAKNVVVVHIEAASIAKAAQFAEPAFKNSMPTGVINFLPVKLPTQDFAPVILQLAQRRPDAIIALLSEGDFVNFIRELRNQGVKAPVYAWAAVVTQRVIENGGASVDGVKGFSYTKAPMSTSSAASEYRTALKKVAPNEKPDFTSYFQFGQTKIFVEALSRVKGPLTHETFYQALYSLKNYDSGVFPPVTFAANKHHGLTALVPVQVKGESWVESGPWIDAANPNW